MEKNNCKVSIYIYMDIYLEHLRVLEHIYCVYIYIHIMYIYMYHVLQICWWSMFLSLGKISPPAGSHRPLRQSEPSDAPQQSFKERFSGRNRGDFNGLFTWKWCENGERSSDFISTIFHSDMGVGDIGGLWDVDWTNKKDEETMD